MNKQPNNIKGIRITGDFSVETLKSRRTEKVAFQVLKEHSYQSRLLHWKNYLSYLEDK